MKKIIFVLAFIASVNIISAQSIKGITIGVLKQDVQYSRFSGLQLEAGTSISLHSKIDYNIRFASDFQNNHSFRTGLAYQLFSKGRFSGSLGLEYHLQMKDYTIYDKGKSKEHKLEVPLHLQYQITDRLNINAAIVPLLHLDDNRTNRQNFDARIGIQYRF